MPSRRRRRPSQQPLPAPREDHSAADRHCRRCARRWPVHHITLEELPAAVTGRMWQISQECRPGQVSRIRFARVEGAMSAFHAKNTVLQIPGFIVGGALRRRYQRAHGRVYAPSPAAAPEADLPAPHTIVGHNIAFDIEGLVSPAWTLTSTPPAEPTPATLTPEVLAEAFNRLRANPPPIGAPVAREIEVRTSQHLQPGDLVAYNNPAQGGGVSRTTDAGQAVGVVIGPGTALDLVRIQVQYDLASRRIREHLERETYVGYPPNRVPAPRQTASGPSDDPCEDLPYTTPIASQQLPTPADETQSHQPQPQQFPQPPRPPYHEFTVYPDEHARHTLPSEHYPGGPAGGNSRNVSVGLALREAQTFPVHHRPTRAVFRSSSEAASLSIYAGDILLSTMPLMGALLGSQSIQCHSGCCRAAVSLVFQD